MARIDKPDFGSRHRRQQTQSSLDGPAPPWWQGFDWKLVALITLVFVASFVWLF